MLDDETLRDGLQSPSVRTPTDRQKIDILHHMDALGIDTADIGLPGAGPKVVEDVERLARAIADERLTIRANCAARTVVADIKPIAEIAAAHRRADRMRRLHRLEPDPAVRGRVDARLPAEVHRGRRSTFAVEGRARR